MSIPQFPPADNGFDEETLPPLPSGILPPFPSGAFPLPDLWNETKPLSLLTFPVPYPQDTDPGSGRHDSPVINPFEHNLPVTMATFGPSALLLLLTSIFVIYIICSKFKPLINLYLPVLFYIVSQNLFMTVVIGCFTSDAVYKEDTLSRCRVKMWLQIFSLVLPGYTIVLITIVRTIFVKRPLNYFYFIRKRYQLVAMAGVVVMSTLLSSAPFMGLCDYVVVMLYEGNQVHLACDFGTGLDCAILKGIIVVLGFLTPVVMVIVLYVVIYKTATTARKSHRDLTRSNRSAELPSNDVNNSVNKNDDNNNNNSDEERMKIPWSILVILGVTLVTTLPWALLILFSRKATELVMSGGVGAALFDVVYSLVKILVSLSPLVYLITTASLRKCAVRMLKWLSCCCGRCQK